ncbi:MAG: hypothetical protein HZB33_11630 [Nitrospirae bacterium]|nr:hypothetical protein [Nitrospirota bacterium]
MKTLIQGACNEASDGECIAAQAATYAEELILSKPVSITIKGGYNCEYSSNPLMTTISGSLTITDGTVAIEKITIR